MLELKKVKVKVQIGVDLPQQAEATTRQPGQSSCVVRETCHYHLVTGRAHHLNWAVTEHHWLLHVHCLHSNWAQKWLVTPRGTGKKSSNQLPLNQVQLKYSGLRTMKYTMTEITMAFPNAEIHCLKNKNCTKNCRKPNDVTDTTAHWGIHMERLILFFSKVFLAGVEHLQTTIFHLLTTSIIQALWQHLNKRYRRVLEAYWGYLLVEAVPCVGEDSFPSHLASVQGQGQDRGEDSSHWFLQLPHKRVVQMGQDWHLQQTYLKHKREKIITEGIIY